MNSIWAILFVVAVTMIGKWLLFDDDDPKSESDEPVSPKVADPPTRVKPPRLSKSA